MITNQRRKRILGGAIATIIVAAVAWAAGTGTSGSLIGPPAVYGPIKMNTDERDGWDVKIMAKDGLSVATQTITFQPNGQSGWHTHPGPVFISVKQGTMTFYEDDCTATVVQAGQGYFDYHAGTHPHLARNETGSVAINVVTYLMPPGSTTLRFDTPPPPDCSLP